MADNSKHHPQRLRTFASDMQAVRGEQEHPVEKPPVKEVVVAAPIPVASAPKPTKPIVRKPDPHIEEPKPSTFAQPHAPTLSELSRNKTATNKIPAFHELQKSVTAIREDITAEPVKKQFHQKKEKLPQKPASRPNIGFDATVITDTKSDRFKLLPSLIESIRSWFKKLVTDNKRKKAPKYTIPEAERRKGVIQRATSKTGTIFTADSETLKEQIRRRRQQEELEDEAETFWTPFTETGFSLLEAPDTPVPTIQNVSVTYKNLPSLQPKPAAQQPLVTPEEQPVIAPEPMLSEEIPPSSEDTSDPLTAARWEASQEFAGEEQLVVPEATEPSSDTPPTEESIPTTRTGLFTTDTNTLTVIILIVILGLVAIIFAARIIITKINEVPEKVSSIEIPTEPVLPNAKLVGVPLTVETLDQLPELVHTAIASSTVGLVEYTIVSAIGDEVSASYLFEILGFQTTPHLRQSITAARFATVNRLEPALVLQFTDTDAVRGGMLAWEATMSADVLSLYDTVGVPSELSFTDENISGFDVRVLRHEDKTVLVYGIVGSNTAIIAPDSALFSQLVELGLAQ